MLFEGPAQGNLLIGPSNAFFRSSIPKFFISLMKSIILSALLAMVTTGLCGQEHEWNNYAGLSGESNYGNGFAIGGQFRNPVGIAVASDGTVYVSDDSSQHIRKISPAGQVSVLAGNPFSSNAYGLVNSNNPDNSFPATAGHGAWVRWQSLRRGPYEQRHP